MTQDIFESRLLMSTEVDLLPEYNSIIDGLAASSSMLKRLHSLRNNNSYCSK